MQLAASGSLHRQRETVFAAQPCPPICSKHAVGQIKKRTVELTSIQKKAKPQKVPSGEGFSLQFRPPPPKENFAAVLLVDAAIDKNFFLEIAKLSVVTERTFFLFLVAKKRKK